MNRISMGTIALGSLLVLTATQGVASAGNKFDHVVGGGQNNPSGGGAVAHFNLNVKSGPNGEDPKGSFKVRVTSDGPPSQQYDATVTCMRVAGNLATVVARIERSKDHPNPVDSYVRVRVEDLGQGNTSQDRIQFGPYIGDPYQCPDPVVPDREPITSGNINVFDS